MLPYARPARDQGTLSAAAPSWSTGSRSGCGQATFDDGRPPARIHGDLWSGNVIFTAAGVVLIDPAAHGGHGLTDLAMLAPVRRAAPGDDHRRVRRGGRAGPRLA